MYTENLRQYKATTSCDFTVAFEQDSYMCACLKLSGSDLRFSGGYIAIGIGGIVVIAIVVLLFKIQKMMTRIG
jgi:hypothetical protein